MSAVIIKTMQAHHSHHAEWSQGPSLEGKAHKE